MMPNPPLNPHTPSHGGQLREIASHFGIPAQEILDFSANINPDGAPPSVLAALHSAISDPASLTAYPDLEYSDLKQSIAAHAGIPASCVSVANGFVPLLQAALAALRPGHCLLPVPAFSEYRSSLEQKGVGVIPFPLEAHGFRYDPDRLFAALLPHTRLGERSAILLANPQNPSGALASAGLMLDLVQRAARCNITVLLDEAFIDYEPSHSLTQSAPSLPNLIVFRSVTKFFALPSLRVAYAVSSPQLAPRISAAIAPWPISTLAGKGLSAALADSGFQSRSRTSNTGRRFALEAQLVQSGIAVYSSAANFLLLGFTPAHLAQRIWRDLIVSERILTRSCLNFEGLSPNHLRVAVRTTSENARLAASLNRVMDRVPDLEPDRVPDLEPT